MADAPSIVSELVRAARARIERDHVEVVGAIDDAADAVAATWDGERTTDGRDVVHPLRTELESRSVHSRLPVVLAEAVDATGEGMAAMPVPAPPYVIVTSRGPVLRATLEPGRLVIRFEAFEVVRSSAPTYRRKDGVEVVVSLE